MSDNVVQLKTDQTILADSPDEFKEVLQELGSRVADDQNLTYPVRGLGLIVLGDKPNDTHVLFSYHNSNMVVMVGALTFAQQVVLSDD